MKTMLTNYRYYVLMALGFIMVASLVAVPNSEAPLREFVVSLLATKAVTIAALIAYCHYYMKWKDEGKIEELVNMEEE